MTEKIDKLIKKYWSVAEDLYDIASNPKTPSVELKKLMELNDEYILTAIALNPNTPVNLLKKLYKRFSGVGGTDDEMRVHIINNPALTDKFLKKCAKKDVSKMVRKAATEALKRKPGKRKPSKSG